MPNKKPFGKKQFFQISLIPILVVIGVLIFYFFVNLLIQEYKGPKDYINEIATESGHKRWQAAFALTKELESSGGKGLDKQETSRLLDLFEKTFNEDPRLTRYLSLALGQLKDPRAVPSLRKSLRLQDEDTVIYSLLGLGHLKATKSLQDIVSLTQHKSPAIRQVAVYVLGVLGKNEAIPPLMARLSDVAPRVKWNAAIALARLKSYAGVKVLREVLRNEPVEEFKNLSPTENEELKLNTVRAIGRLENREFLTDLERIKNQDPSFKVRNEAAKAIKSLIMKLKLDRKRVDQ